MKDKKENININEMYENDSIISKEQFMIICSVINENLTFEEKIKFIKEIKTKE